MMTSVAFAAARQAGADEPLELLLRQMKETSESAGVIFLATRFTTAGPQDTEEGPFHDDYFAERCRRAGVRFVSVRGAFTEKRRSYMAKLPGYLGYDSHYSQKGTRTYAQALAPALDAVLRQAGL
jgi:hypothetical protein